MMLALAGGSIFTGCIDNDEPEGIIAVRLATADLLKAQAAALQAQKDAESAKVEIAKIEAETAAAELKIKQAQAEAEATIAKLQAEAEAARTQAQAAQLQAQADKVKAETEAYIALEKAGLDKFIAKAEVEIKTAQLAYDKALYEFEQEKVKNANEVTNSLYDAYVAAFGVYLQKLDAYNTANEALLYAQKDYAMAAVDLKYENGEWKSPVYDAKEKLYSYREYLANETEKTKKTIAEYEEFISDLNGVTATDLYKLYEKYNGLKEQAQADVNAAETELAVVKGENKDLYEKVYTLEGEASEIQNEEHPVAAYTYPGSTLLPLVGYQEEYPLIPEGAQWSMRTAPSTYNMYVNEYEWLIKNLTESLLDENDEAWTQATLNELNRKLAADTEEFDKLKAAWEVAKKGYNNGGVADATAYPDAADVKKAVDAFNASAEVLNPLVAAYKAANEAKVEAQKAFQKALDDYNGHGTVAGTNATAVYNATMQQLSEESTEAYNAFDEVVTPAADKMEKANIAALQAKNNARTIALEAEGVYNALLADKTATQAQIDAAKKKWEDAEKAVEKAAETYATAVEANEKAYYDTYNTAFVKYVQAQNVINEKKRAAYTTLLQNTDVDDPANTDKDPAYAPVAAAEKAVNDADEKVNDAWKAIVAEQEGVENLRSEAMEAIQTQLKDLDYNNMPTTDFIATTGGLNNYFSSLYFWQDDVEFPTAYAPAELVEDGVYVFAKDYLIYTSQNAYGNFLVDQDSDKGYPELSNEAFLVDVTPEMINEYIKRYSDENNLDIAPWNYYQYYYMFGAYGDVLLLQDRITVATAMLNNNDLINEMLKEPEANLADLKAEFESVEDALKANELAQADVNKQIDAIEKAAKAKVADANWSLELYSGIVADLQSDIAVAEGYDLGDKDLNTYIEEQIADYEGQIEARENYITGYIEVLQKENEYQIDLYEKNEATVLPNPYTIAVKIAENNVAEAKENLDYWSDRTADAKAAYEATKK